MRIDFDRFVPLGLDGKNESQWILAGLIVSALSALINFSNQYTDALSRLYVYGLGTKRLIPGAVMAPFYQTVMGCEVGFTLVCLAMALLAVYHYHYHTQGSKSIYLMRRLPRSWELHMRCLGLPVLGAAGAMASLGLLTVFFYLIYRFCTPAQCLPY